MVQRASVLRGDCVQVMRNMPDNAVDSVVCDPPYELGFMGKAWDNTGVAYRVETWIEALRVLKPGGHLLAFGGTRTAHRLACAIEDAGFEIRDTIQWLYGSGFPKSKNLGDGWGSALKPAHEPIIMARKPLSEKNLASNVLEWGTGGLNIDASRVGATNFEPKDRVGAKKLMEDRPWQDKQAENGRPRITEGNSLGRFPANLILSHSEGCNGECVEGCPVKVLDEQSGVTKSGGYPAEGGQRSHVATYGKPNERGEQRFGSSEGGASRFFYCAKASRAERNRGLEGMPEKVSGGMSGTADLTLKTGSGNVRNNKASNHHPTVKPVKLLSYLCKLVTPPGGVVLDCFAGSGTTGVAALSEGFNAILIEQDESYADIAEARCAHAMNEISGRLPL